jgi:hypothetical protein
MVSQKIIRIALLTAFSGLVLKAILKGIGLPESIVVLGLLGFEGFLQYMAAKQVLIANNDVMNKLSSLESKVSALHITRRIS